MFEIKVTIEAGRTIEALSEKLFALIQAGALDKCAERNAGLELLARREHEAAAEPEGEVAIKSIEQIITHAVIESHQDDQKETERVVEPKPEKVQESPKAETQKAEAPKAEAPKAETPKAETPKDGARGKGAAGPELATLTAEFVNEVCQKAERATLNKNLRTACDKLGIAIATVPSLLQAVGYDEAMRLCVGG